MDNDAPDKPSPSDRNDAGGLSAALKGLPPEFAGFAQVFERDIRPSLIAREADRVAAAERAIQTRWIGGAIILVGALAGFVVLRLPLVGVLAIMAGIGVIVWGHMGVSRLAAQAKTLIVAPIAGHFGLSFDPEPGEPAAIARHRDLSLVPGWDRASYEDLVTGKRGEVDFELFEAHLEERRTSTDSKGNTRTEWVTVFRGQCLRLDFHKRFYGRTLISRDAGFFNRFGGGPGLQRARLEDPEFEKIFEVYTTDQVEARFLLTPDLMQRLVDIERTFRGGKLKACFDGGEMLISVQGGDLFEPGSMFKPLDNPERVRELLDDFSAVFNLIDTITRSPPRRPDPGLPTG